MKKQAKGFTLLELMITIAIIVILALIAAPSFSRMMAKNRLNTVVAEWRSAFYLAQKEAIRTKKEVKLCPSNNGRICTGRENYSQGWIVWQDNGTPDGLLIRDYPPITDNNIQLNIRNGGEIEFTKSGRLPASFAGANVRFEAEHSKYSDMTIKLKISRSGRIGKDKT